MVQGNQIQRVTRYEIQEYVGGYAGFAATYEVHPNGKVENILNIKISRTIGDPRVALLELKKKLEVIDPNATAYQFGAPFTGYTQRQ